MSLLIFFLNKPTFPVLVILYQQPTKFISYVKKSLLPLADRQEGQPEQPWGLLGRGHLLRDIGLGRRLLEGRPSLGEHVQAQAADLVPQVHHRQHHSDLKAGKYKCISCIRILNLFRITIIRFRKKPETLLIPEEQVFSFWVEYLADACEEEPGDTIRFPVKKKNVFFPPQKNYLNFCFP